MTKKRNIRKVHRDAVTGKFVPEEYVKKHPKTTVTETMKVSRRRRRRK